LRKTSAGLLGLTLTAALAVGGGGLAVAGPSEVPGPVSGVGHEGPLAPTKAPSGATGALAKTADELLSPQETRRRAEQQKALNLVLTGQQEVRKINGAEVVKVGTKPAPLSREDLRSLAAGRTVEPRQVDSYVQLSRERTEKIFVVLAEFGNERAPGFPDKDINPGWPGPSTFQGPLRNAIPEPDRSADNSTVWQADYSAAHYRKLYFGEGVGVESLKSYYEKQSSGRYSVDGEVTDWVKVRYNEAAYGRSDDPNEGKPGDDPAVCGSNVCSNTWNLLRDALNQWVADQKAAGRTSAQIKADVAAFDRQDRYDFDGDGNFNEPDGYLDHFQIVHAGGDQADVDPYQGEDAIWSHRSYAYLDNIGRTGPATNKLGGTEVGDTGLWVGDYTIQPENGGLSVFAHEYGHDLGLPDHYDTTGAGDNPVNWWTLMAQSRARAKDDMGIGTRPADLGVWDKLQLGWLDYEVALAGQQKSFDLGPHEYNSKKPQALAVVLPTKSVTTDLPTPPEGSKQWWSGEGDDLTSTLTRAVTLGSGPATLTFQANYNIEDCGADPCDSAFVEVNDGSGWKALPGSITIPAEGNAINGTSKGWLPATFDLSAYAGRGVQLRFRYSTDGAVSGNNAEVSGFFVDAIRLTSGGTAVFTDGAENGTNGWTASGFSAVGSSQTKQYAQYYLASNRTDQSYDRYLKTGPYNFGFTPALPRKAEFFPYQPGLLVNYWDTSLSDNNTSEHPGQGLVLPVDAHPDLIANLAGKYWRGRIQDYDAPFSLRPADSFTLHVDGQPSYIRGAPAQPLFDDTRSYWRSEQPNMGVKTPAVGVTLQVTQQQGTSMSVRLGTSTPVSPAATLASARLATTN
jgi:immune inhibitor A